MSVITANRTIRETAAPVGRSYWLTEFERVYLMTSARYSRRAGLRKGRPRRSHSGALRS
jgi:hypothetical protein